MANQFNDNSQPVIASALPAQISRRNNSIADRHFEIKTIARVVRLARFHFFKTIVLMRPAAVFSLKNFTESLSESESEKGVQASAEETGFELQR